MTCTAHTITDQKPHLLLTLQVGPACLQKLTLEVLGGSQ